MFIVSCCVSEVFQTTAFTIEEPEISPVEISLPIVRRAGTMGQVTVQWQATVNSQEAKTDVFPSSGEVSFAEGETTKVLKVKVLPDDVPEITEVRDTLLLNLIVQSIQRFTVTDMSQ